MTIQELLHKYFGHTSFREGQEEAVKALLSRRDVLAVMPTGAGKSVCYQLPAICMNGTALVISPLISLMKDQVEGLIQSGISAAYINSTQTYEEYQSVMYFAKARRYKLLYIAPERLLTESFLRFSVSAEISMVIVDEAHCVSQWGQDFRQSYLDISKFLSMLPIRPAVGAFTATATKNVKNDIMRLLSLKEPEEITTGFDRKNLYFGVEKPKDKKAEVMRLLGKYKGRSGIVYCISRKQVEELCEDLILADFSATRYHAGLSPEERSKNQEDFIYDRKNIMVATNAFGMGIDKSNVSFVIHYNMPKDIESYYQEAGRAGRDGEPADCVLLYSGRDVRTNEFLIEQSRENEEIGDITLRTSLINKAKDRLRSMTIYCTAAECNRNYMLRYFGEKPSEPCGHCSGCKGNTEKKDITLEAIKIISCVYRGAQKGYHLSRTKTAQVLTGSEDKTVLAMGLQKLSTYGIMSDSSVTNITQIIDSLIARGELGTKPYKEYSELVLTPLSASIVRRERNVEIYVTKAPKDAPVPIKVSPEEEQLFQRLRKLREKISLSENVPPYVIFSNAALRDMCRKKPQTLQELMDVSGVGVMRSQKYGSDFVREIKRFIRKK